MSNDLLYTEALASYNQGNLYPPITLESLENIRIAKANAKINPNYFENAPYDPRTTTLLKEIATAPLASPEEIDKDIESYFGSADNDQTFTILVRDAQRLYLAVSRMSQKLENSEKPEEQINRARAVAQLQERLLAVINKAEGYEQVHKFKSTINSIISQVLNPEQRTLVMQQLEDALKS